MTHTEHMLDQTNRGTVTFSIIVPACNVGPYAAKMLQSVLAQTFTDFECIIGAEESSDDTMEVLEREAHNDPRIRIVKMPKTGSASAPRNYGIKHAVGKWVVFLDGDDWLEPDALENLLKKAEQHDPDVIVTDSKTWHYKEDGSMYSTSARPIIQGGENFLSGATFLTVTLIKNRYRSAVWNYCFRRSLLLAANLDQPIGRFHQDDAWTWRILLFAWKVVPSECITYNYLRRPRSVTAHYTSKSVFDVAEILIENIAVWKQMNEAGESFEKIQAAAYYMTNTFNMRFFATHIFSKIPPDDCKRAIHMIVRSRQTEKTIRRMLQYVRVTRRFEVALLLLVRFHGGFFLCRFASIHLIDPAKILFGKLRRLFH